MIKFPRFMKRKRFQVQNFVLGVCAASFFIVFSFPHSAAAFKRVFLRPDSTSPWTVVADWSDTNVVEVIGGGAGGTIGSGNAGAGGGSGGGYAMVRNMAGLSGTVTFQVATSVGAIGGATGALGNDTFFARVSGVSGLCTGTGGVMRVCAKGGDDPGALSTGGASAGGTGCATGSSVGSTTFSCGNGGSGNGLSDSGGGGGGAAGPYGNGANGGNGDADNTTNAVGGGGGGGDGGSNALTNGAAVGGYGGNDRFGFGGGAGGSGNATTSSAGGGGGNDAGAGGLGGNSTTTITTAEWNAPEFGFGGSGGGGGGGGDSAAGANGGLYGGGGGGGNTTAGRGAGGLIVLTYSPDVPTAARATKLLGNVRLLGGVRLLFNDPNQFKLLAWHTVSRLF
jgi:hypothetical protein